MQAQVKKGYIIGIFLDAIEETYSRTSYPFLKSPSNNGMTVYDGRIMRHAPENIPEDIPPVGIITCIQRPLSPQ
jgi:hypothetical protein